MKDGWNFDQEEENVDWKRDERTTEREQEEVTVV